MMGCLKVGCGMYRWSHNYFSKISQTAFFKNHSTIYCKDIIGTEVTAVKEALDELNQERDDYECELCQSQSCVFCRPMITMVRFQYNNGMKCEPYLY
jgi:uncharacterized protein YxjI